jgi:hypothetical protein
MCNLPIKGTMRSMRIYQFTIHLSLQNFYSTGTTILVVRFYRPGLCLKKLLYVKYLIIFVTYFNFKQLHSSLQMSVPTNIIWRFFGYSVLPILLFFHQDMEQETHFIIACLQFLLVCKFVFWDIHVH